MKVSVIIPCHNVGAYIGHCLASVMQQDHQDVEVICVDDASTDGTVAVIEAFSLRHPQRIELLRSTERRGANHVRNEGLAKATGRYIQFLDADDVLLPGKIERGVKLATLHDGPDLIAGAYMEVHPDGMRRVVLPETEDPWMGLIRGRMGTTSANLWKRSSVLTAGAWDPQLASSQDHELIFRMLQAGARCISDMEVGTEVLKRASGSISRSNIQENLVRFLTLRAAIRDHLQQADLDAHKLHVREAERQMYIALLAIGTTEPARAKALHKTLLGNDHVPAIGPGLSRSLALAHALLGFSGVLHLRNGLLRLRG
jgi:glycosyltransferase involved in cell wall biosynthesis